MTPFLEQIGKVVDEQLSEQGIDFFIICLLSWPYFMEESHSVNFFFFLIFFLFTIIDNLEV